MRTKILALNPFYVTLANIMSIYFGKSKKTQLIKCVNETYFYVICVNIPLRSYKKLIKTLKHRIRINTSKDIVEIFVH